MGLGGAWEEISHAVRASEAYLASAAGAEEFLKIDRRLSSSNSIGRGPAESAQ